MAKPVQKRAPARKMNTGKQPPSDPNRRVHQLVRRHTYPTITRAEAEAWRDLHRLLARTRTLQGAKAIAAQTAPAHAKRFYAHLRSFVRTLNLPRHGTRSELYVYAKLRLRFTVSQK